MDLRRKKTNTQKVLLFKITLYLHSDEERLSWSDVWCISGEKCLFLFCYCQSFEL